MLANVQCLMHTNGCNFLEANLPTIDPPLTRGFVPRGLPSAGRISRMISGRATAGVVEGSAMTHGSKLTV